MSDVLRWAACAAMILLGLALSFGLAAAGHPSSAWLWRLIL